MFFNCKREAACLKQRIVNYPLSILSKMERMIEINKIIRTTKVENTLHKMQ